MKPRRLIFSALLLGLTGCAPDERERAATQKARLELEEKARRDADAANKALSELNRKRFGQPPPATPPASPQP